MRSQILSVMSLLPALLAFSSSLALAHPQCGDGFRSDSYGRGIEAGFRASGSLRPKLVDEGCYLLGIRRGQAIKNATQVFDCEGDFERGFERGFQSSYLSAGSECYNGGYSAGVAALDVGAREKNSSLVGADCVAAYESGVSDNSNGKISQLPTTEEPVATCYRLGYYDGRYPGQH